MPYNFDFDITALLITGIVIFFFYNKKNISTFQNRIFLMIPFVLLVAIIIDLFLTFQICYNFHVPIPLLWILNGLSYTCTNLFGALFVMYCIALIDYFSIQTKKVIRIVTLLVLVPVAIMLLCIWASPIFYYFYDFPLVFYIDNAGNYHRGNNFFFYMLYFFSAYHVFLSFWLLLRNRKMVKTKYVLLLLGYVVAVFATVLIQFFFPKLLVQYFGMAIASLVFLYYIQRPEEVLNPATECFNHTAFAKIVPQQIRGSDNVCCISIILDDTSFMANTFGISRLDDFLREVAAFLKQNFKYRDIYQLNEGCFCIILRNPSEAELQNVINLLQSRFDKIWKYKSIHLKLYSRLCVIRCPKEAKTAEEIIDIINFVTKEERYKQTIVYASEIDLECKRRNAFLEHVILKGLSENRLEVYYQPIFASKEKRLIGAEALIRLKDDEGNFISPEDFIPIAEKNGSILRIGEFVFESVCRTLSSISPEYYGITKIDINLSVAQCMQEILAEQIMAIRSMYNVPTELINLEITETAAAHTPDILLKNMELLADAGFELSLDDYGSGYSNMGYMLSLPFKMIKIDKYIVWAAFEDNRAKTALSATIDMIKKIGMTVLAEGVETKEQADWLMEEGCDYLQGFYFSKAVPQEEFFKLMLESNGVGEKKELDGEEFDNLIEVE